jgi:hypothetical protein
MQSRAASNNSLLKNKNASLSCTNNQKSSKTLIVQGAQNNMDNKDIDSQSINIIIMGDQTTADDGFDKKKRALNTYSSNHKHIVK